MPRILLVDDEPVILLVLSRLLAAEGRELLKASSAAEARAIAETSGPIELALLDKNLSDGTGMQLARELRARQPDLEVILMTAYASVESAVEALELGAFDYLVKPIADFDQLERKVVLALERQQLRREERARLDRSEQRLEAVSQAAGEMAHDFNNLLTVILVNGEVLLARLGADERQAQRVRGILDAGGQSANLVRQLMRLAPSRPSTASAPSGSEPS
jgi:DNA-binding NtrC family response regulator